MPMIIKNKCPCEGCKFYTYGKQHPNPNAYDEHYCEKKEKSIIQHSGNGYHYAGQWVIPCGRFSQGREPYGG